VAKLADARDLKSILRGLQQVAGYRSKLQLPLFVVTSVYATPQLPALTRNEFPIK